MRPDFVTEKYSPVLWRFASEGVVFRRHHAVYPSATEVNGVALATGLYPSHSGMIANHEYRPEIDSRKSIDTEVSQVVRRGDELSHGNYLAAPTIAELVRKSDRRSVIAGAKGVALLYDRHLTGGHAQNSVALFAGETLPPDALAQIVARIGVFPRSGKVAAPQRDEWTTKALVESLWKDGVPDFSLLWLAEPDFSEHNFAPGSKEALAAIKGADENLGRVLAAMDRDGARETTDIFVVSDHGFSTIQRSIDLREILKRAGFNAVTEFGTEPKAGQIMLVGNGGMVLFYVIQHDPSVIQRLVEFLQRSDFAGVIFTKQPMKGTFAFDEARIDMNRAPDIEMAFRWSDTKNQFGVPGMIDGDWLRAAGQGTHATLSRFDMHNTLIAAGPDFRRGDSNELPSGNVDLAPTILQILGINSPQELDGRVLSEAMIDSGAVQPKSERRTIEATREFSSGNWRQTLSISRVGSTIYLDEGNGEFVATSPH
jgi:predicted AlkP superfamily pyrophosphatase or phosphodiesterase